MDIAALFAHAAHEAARFLERLSERVPRPERMYAASVEAFAGALPGRGMLADQVIAELVGKAEPGPHDVTVIAIDEAASCCPAPAAFS